VLYALDANGEVLKAYQAQVDEYLRISGDLAAKIPDTATLESMNDPALQLGIRDILSEGTQKLSILAIQDVFQRLATDFILPSKFVTLYYRPDVQAAISVKHASSATLPLEDILAAEEKRGTDGLLHWVAQSGQQVGWYVIGDKLVFVDTNGNKEMMNGILQVSYSYIHDGYDGLFGTASTVTVADGEAAQVLIVQSDGSTDLSESDAVNSVTTLREFKFGPFTIKLPITTFGSAEIFDTYQVMLTKAVERKSDGTDGVVSVVVNPKDFSANPAFYRNLLDVSAADPTDTRVVRNKKPDNTYDGTLTLNFTSSDWTPITLKVKAIDDSVVQDPNKQVFAEQTRVTSRIQGALYLYGGGGDGSLVGTTSQTLPYEQDVPVTHGAADFKVNTDPATGKVTTTEIEITFSKVPKEFRIDPDDEASLFDIAKFNASTRANSIGLVNGELGQFWGIASAAYTDGTGADKSKVTFICDRFHGMDLSQPSDLPFDDGDAVSMSHMSNNFYVDETTQSDRIYINNQESVAQDESGSINRLTDDLKGNTASSLAAEMAAAGGLRVSGLGMAAGITNGSPTFFDMDNPGGIMFQDMEQAEVNLGANGNYFTVNATLADGIRKTATVVNGGSGVDHLGIGSLKKEPRSYPGCR
jgi:hypothetical protein